MKKILLFLPIFTFYLVSFSFTQDWDVKFHTNPIDDSQIFQISKYCDLSSSNCDGKLIIVHDIGKEDGPMLLADKVYLNIDQYFFDSLNNTIIYRFDKEASITQAWIPTNENKYVFIDNAKYFLYKIVRAEQLSIAVRTDSKDYILVFKLKDINNYLKACPEIKWNSNSYIKYQNFEKELENILISIGGNNIHIYPFGNTLYNIVMPYLKTLSYSDLESIKKEMYYKIGEINKNYQKGNIPDVFKFYSDYNFSTDSIFNINFSGIKYYD